MQGVQGRVNAHISRDAREDKENCTCNPSLSHAHTHPLTHPLTLLPRPHRYEPYVAPALARVAGPAAAASWAGSSLLPATLAYSTVKGVGWYDWGDSGLNDLEKKINGLTSGHRG